MTRSTFQCEKSLQTGWTDAAFAGCLWLYLLSTENFLFKAGGWKDPLKSDATARFQVVQFIDCQKFSAHFNVRHSRNRIFGLKILVSVVRFRPGHQGNS